jgi:hypothetical protein
MFLCKRARPDVNLVVGFLSSRVTEPNEGDWRKLLKTLGFLKGTIDDVLQLEADDKQTLSWYIDAAFAVHMDMKSHTGAVFTMGKGALVSDSRKQRVNSRSSTESEIVGVDDEIHKVIWAKRFIEYQGFKVKHRHFDIKIFYVTDLVSRNEVQVKHCPTDEMIGDYMTKPLVGSKFKRFRDLIMNLSGIYHQIGQQECVGKKQLRKTTNTTLRTSTVRSKKKRRPKKVVLLSQ